MFRRVTYTRKEVADLIRRFLSGNVSPWEWDDFISIPLRDPQLESVRKVCGSAPDDYPALEPARYCNQEGAEMLRKLAAAIESSDE